MRQTTKTLKLIHEWHFGVLLGIFLICLQLFTLLIIIFSAPQNTTWLGGISAYNFHDLAVYINYLEQSKNSFLITNLYNPLPQIPRFDAFWSLGGILVKIGIPAKFAHEILRYFSTFILSITLYWIAKKQTHAESHARLATIFMICGMSTGILNAIWQKILYGNDIIRYISPDLDSDFAVSPTLFAGAHVILSIALQFISIHFLWHGLQEKNVKKILISGATALFLTLFHPYFIPLIGLIALITTAYPNFKELKKRLKIFLLFNLFLIPSSTYYLFLMRDSAFKTHHLQINQLPLAHPIFWIITLLPFIIAIIWMKLKKTQIINQNNYWAFVWLIAATICMLLPFPWTRKYTQALLPVLIITTLPFWLHFADTLLKQSKNFLKPLLLLGCFLPYLYLFQITLTIINHPKWKYMIYHPNTMIQAWDYIQSNSPSNSLILTDSLWSNIWLPAYTNRHVWVGHPHETPEYDQKINQFQEWLLTQDNNQFNSYLNVSKINYLITQDSFSEQAETLLDKHWHKTWQIDSTIIWQNTN